MSNLISSVTSLFLVVFEIGNELCWLSFYGFSLFQLINRSRFLFGALLILFHFILKKNSDFGGYFELHNSNSLYLNETGSESYMGFITFGFISFYSEKKKKKF